MSQSNRISGGQIDRSKTFRFSFDGHVYTGHPGDTLASALLANGVRLMGRSFKYHRPRGPISAGSEEPNALVQLRSGARQEPNTRATVAELFDGLEATSQNAWPSLKLDAMAVNDRLNTFFTAGFYYKTFMWPAAFWEKVYEPIIRRAAGLGSLTKEEDPDEYDKGFAHCDLLVIGAGPAGLMAALTAGRASARVILADEDFRMGGRLNAESFEVGGQAGADWAAAAVAELASLPNVRLMPRTTVTGAYDGGIYGALERVGLHKSARPDLPREAFWRITARRAILAAGALERPIAFPMNDRPGIMMAGAVQTYLNRYGVAPGKRVTLFANNDGARAAARDLMAAGVQVAAIIDSRLDASAVEDCPVYLGGQITDTKGRTGLAAIAGTHVGGAFQIETDLLAMSGGWNPTLHLTCHMNGRPRWNDEIAAFVPAEGAVPGLMAAGSANGTFTTHGCLAAGHEAAKAALGDLGLNPGKAALPKAEGLPYAIEPLWAVEGKGRAWLDFANDVTTKDVKQAAVEGYASVEHMKRYTTQGMAPDQGKNSNVGALAVLADATGRGIPQTGTTTFRPPYTPVTLGALAGESRGEIFQPLRMSPIHRWHESNGAYMEPVGLWRRAYCYPRGTESHEQAVHREILNARENVGMLDASTLGKIIVKGPDAGKFLDMLYTGVMSTLPIGKCRYGLMCNEQGFLSDDGVVARIDEETWLCHTTSGGADRIHAWMEDWLQCEWWDWQVYATNVTEEYSQIAVAGPKARKVLEKLGGMDVSKEALPFMTFADGTLGGLPVRVHRISFSGELSYEIATPAGHGLALWEALMAAGAEFGVMPYGTEAMHIMRAEKGFIMIGDETDGTVIPQDLNLGWAISKKKADYLGKRGQERTYLASPDRWKLAGFEALDGSVIPDGSYIIADGYNGNGQRNTQGRVTSTYYSPTLKKGIAMGLVKGGMDRLGDVVEFNTLTTATVKARVVDPVFYDKDGEKGNA